MYTFNLLDSSLSSSSTTPTTTATISIENNCHVNELKLKISEIINVSPDLFDVYCHGLRLSNEKSLHEFDFIDDQSETLLIKPHLNDVNRHVTYSMPTDTELKQCAKTIAEKSTNGQEFHRLHWLMKSSEFWKKLYKQCQKLY